MGIVRSRIERQVQDEWRGLIAIYLFFGGLGGGAYTVAATGSLLGDAWATITTAGLWISWISVGVGLLFLASHLGKPFRAPLAMAKVGSSWISRGVWILGIFGVIAVVHTFFFDGAEVPAALPILGILFGMFTMVYTGALIGGSKGFPFWNTGILPILFLISGLLTGMFAAVIGAAAMDSASLGAAQMQNLAAVGALLIVVELITLFFFLHSSYRSVTSRESAQRMMGKGSFVFGDLIIGLTVPLIVCLVVYFGELEAEAMVTAMSVAAVCALIGGFLLRNAILGAGMQSTLSMAGFNFRPIAKVDFVHSEAGRIPPS
ncbi:MAG: polysulfide reductase NrfD [Deltaproteobacteria bacterium]|nr:polysulfide reductase NrfD [Deltaproteobacteria bacterium]